MAKFFVGQRVRLVVPQEPSPGSAPIQVGDQGVVRSLSFYPKGSRTRGGSVTVSDSDIQVEFLGGGFRSTHTSRLEPILPEGSAPSEFTFQQLMDSLQEATA